MPEGPSIVILKEEAAGFEGKKILSVSGNSKQDIEQLKGKKVISFKSWGKHFLICVDGFTVKIHFLLFGSYRINEEKLTPPRLSLQFKNGKINFYACSIKFIYEDLDELYDWRTDLLNENWSPALARKKLKEKPVMLACDALLDQNIFAGSGNIIKNEVLFRTRIHPLSRIGKIPPGRLSLLIREARNYSFDFLIWKKAYVLKKHWLAHTKKICPRCELPFVKQYLGKTNRRSFFCTNCQKLYS